MNEERKVVMKSEILFNKYMSYTGFCDSDTSYIKN